MGDKILVRGARYYGRHGVTEAERQIGGRYTVDVELAHDLKRAAASDQVQDTISYADVYRVVGEIVHGTSLHLVESLAETIAQTVLERFPASAVLVRVLKEPPPLAGAVDAAGVEIYRERPQSANQAPRGQ